MTLPAEEVRAIKNTRVFLADVVNRRYRPGWIELRQRASDLLKHYPYFDRINEMCQPYPTARKQPHLWVVWAIMTIGVLVGLVISRVYGR